MDANKKIKMSKDLSTDLKNVMFRLLKEGKSQVEIAKILGVSKQRVNYHVQGMRSGKDMTSKANSGRKSKVTEEIKNFIMSKVNENRFISGPELSTLVENEFNVSLHHKTVKRSARKSGFELRSARKVPLINNKNKKKRLEAVQQFLLKPISFWKQVIWSDETKINLFGSEGKKWVWRTVGEAYVNECTKKL